MDINKDHNGWVAKVCDGELKRSVIYEGEVEFGSIPPESIEILIVVVDGVEFSLPAGKSGYFQSKSACCSPGLPMELLSRNIGYRMGNIEVTLKATVENGGCKIFVTGD